ncbi:OmpA family protein [Galbibacter sp. EGI 63066]|uniref:OmpA family protein n=1 Tax=Galbibacter sp. EGI 63066 TaxID=2993559 RepID=UPI00224896E0|nr:OmpA family protein [Galbibacter sp. EGI 63066]MCX2679309.1 OmpA family protein [Galbibacter sp. EGI 63066]
MKKYITLILAVIIHMNSYSQATWKADEYYDNFQFDKAAELYLKVIHGSNTINNDDVENLANCYFNLFDFQSAYVWYDKLYGLKEKNVKESTFIKYVQSAKAVRDYEKANRLIREYYTDDLDRLEMITTQKKHLDSLSGNDPLYKVYNLGINTAKAEFAPIFYKDHLVFSSSRDSIIVKENLYQWNKQPYLDLYIADRNKSNGELKNLRPFGENLNSRFHSATVSFSKNEKFVFFTQNYVKNKKLKSNKDGISKLKIVRGYVEGDRITNVEDLAFNNPEYSNSHPTITPNGKYLYFVSDRPGGYGETDIYVAEVFEDGKTNTPVNLGPMVNTAGREMFPFATDSILYFASDSHYGLGGLDIFESKIKSKTDYTIPINLGPVVNSNMDDFSYIIDPVENTGYFASNRSMGKGDDDIYYFKKKKPILYQHYSGHVYDKVTEAPIPDASVIIHDVLSDMLTHHIETDEDGYYKLKLPFKKEHKLLFSKPNYTSETVYAKITDDPNAKLENNNVYLTSLESLTVKEGNQTKIDVDPIYFEYNKADITPQAIAELEKVLFVMNEFPGVRIIIESHTDSRGSDNYNFSLSNERAESTKRYLIASGIAEKRIVGARGFGETKLKNRCSNGVRCSEADHSVNRRSNFIIIEKQTLETKDL